MSLDEDTLTGRPLQGFEMFSQRPGMYGSTRVFLSSPLESLLDRVIESCR